MTYPLHNHPLTPCPAVKALTVSLARQADGGVCLRYQLDADLAMLRFPPAQAAGFADGLWEHTCFEAFIGVQGESRYHEFNFSPSRQWAAYAFGGYRERLAWAVGKPPQLDIAFLPVEGRFQLEAIISADQLPDNPENRPFEAGLTAVIEAVAGEKSYWALLHPAERPDFHQRNGFVAIL